MGFPLEVITHHRFDSRLFRFENNPRPLIGQVLRGEVTHSDRSTDLREIKRSDWLSEMIVRVWMSQNSELFEVEEEEEERKE